MKSLANLSRESAGKALLADDVLEFHAARLLLLIRLCGTANRIDGLTKMAKLDFFVRYPQFFEAVSPAAPRQGPLKSVESSMVRFHYGPWDKRYYHVLSYLEAKALITVSQEGKQLRLRLTELGKQAADAISERDSFKELTLHMKRVKTVLGGKSGSSQKFHTTAWEEYSESPPPTGDPLVGATAAKIQSLISLYITPETDEDWSDVDIDLPNVDGQSDSISDRSQIYIVEIGGIYPKRKKPPKSMKGFIGSIVRTLRTSLLGCFFRTTSTHLGRPCASTALILILLATEVRCSNRWDVMTKLVNTLKKPVSSLPRLDFGERRWLMIGPLSICRVSVSLNSAFCRQDGLVPMCRVTLCD